MVNVHFSLLPRWRGAAPVERAVLAGDAETGVCLMELEEGLDTGPVYAGHGNPDRARRDRRRAARPPRPNGHRAAAEEPGRWPRRAGAAARRADICCQDQPRRAAPRLRPAGRDLQPGRAGGQGVDHLERQSACSFTGHGCSASSRTLSAGQIQGDRVGTAEGALELLVVQPEGKPPMDAAAWARGARLAPGERLGE